MSFYRWLLALSEARKIFKSWVSTIHMVVLTADVFQFFIKKMGATIAAATLVIIAGRVIQGWHIYFLLTSWNRPVLLLGDPTYSILVSRRHRPTATVYWYIHSTYLVQHILLSFVRSSRSHHAGDVSHAILLNIAFKRFSLITWYRQSISFSIMNSSTSWLYNIIKIVGIHCKVRCSLAGHDSVYHGLDFRRMSY